MTIVAALFDNPQDGRSAVRALKDAGLAPDMIGFLARETETDRSLPQGTEPLGLAPSTVSSGGAIIGAGELSDVGDSDLVGSLQEHGVDAADAELFAECLRRGGAVVTADVVDSHSAAVSSILWNAGAVDLAERRNEYRGDGWSGFDEAAGPLSDAEIAEERERHQPHDAPLITPAPSRH